MSREKQIEIKVVTYKEERLNYFTVLYEKATNKFDRLFKKHKDASYLSDEFKKMSDAGHEAEFLGDVVKMLKQSEWISVEERLPKESGKYLVSTLKGNVYQTKFYEYPETKGGHWGQKDKGRSITHWMPLPEAPKGGAE